MADEIPAVVVVKPDPAPPAPKGKPKPDTSPYVMQRVTNNTSGPRSINTQNGVQMLEAGASGEAMVHENEGSVAPVIDGLVFETI